MHELYELKEKLLNELEEYSRKEMTSGSLEVIDKLSHAIKNICKILESADEEYSGRSYNSRGTYDGRMTGGMYSTRRDSQGRYTRNYSRNDGGNYSRADGMDSLVNQIQGMMQDLPQNVQQDAQRFVMKLEQSM